MAQHNMIDLKRTVADRDVPAVAIEDEDKPFFPLSLFVHTPEIVKLNLIDFEVGQEHDLNARVRVTSINIDPKSAKRKVTSMELTLIKGEVNSAHKSDPVKQAEKLFGK